MIAVNGAPPPLWSGGDPNEAGVLPDPSAELLALWQSVFQNSYAVSAGVREVAPGSQAGRAKQSGSVAGDSQSSREAVAPHGGDVADSNEKADGFASAMVFGPEAMPAPQEPDTPIVPGLTRVVASFAEAQEWTGSPAANADGILAAGGNVRLSGTRGATEETASTAQPKPACVAPAPETAPAEAVSVFSHGTGIAIVVRDSSLSREEALRCAFETAQQLTGRRATLALLTVNGQILYQQISAPHQPPSSNPLWKMVC
jgi:hypothetical protein